VRIGWAQCDVTPSRPACLRGQFYVRVARTAKDPLTATALAIEGTGPSGASDCAVIVSCDRVSIPAHLQQRVRDAVAPRLPGLDARKVFLHATHTHDAPEVDDGFYPPQGSDVMTPAEYAGFFATRVADAVVQAWESRRPAGLSRAFGHAVVGHNRRAVYLGGEARMYGKTDTEDFSHIEGAEDHSVDMLFTWGEGGRLTGIVVNLACPSQVEEHLTEFSADFWHDVRVELRRRHGDGVFVLAQCSPAGDQSPHLLLYGREEGEMRRRRGVSERQEIARRIARAVDEGLEVAGDGVETAIPVCHGVRTVELPVRLVTYEEAAAAQAEIERLEAEEPADEPAASMNRILRLRNSRVLERHRAQQSSAVLPVELHVLRLGDVAMATSPFELFLDFGQRIKARSRAAQTMLVQLACDACGYLPTERAVRGRSYGAEVASNLVGPEGGQVLVDATVEEIDRLFPEQSSG
jgi:hypothetical protein